MCVQIYLVYLALFVPPIQFVWVYMKCFVFCAQADAPNTGLIPESDAVGVTVVLITCTYRSQEFIRIGYYVNNEYTDPELRENPPIKPDYTQVTQVSFFQDFCMNMQQTSNQHFLSPTSTTLV